MNQAPTNDSMTEKDKTRTSTKQGGKTLPAGGQPPQGRDHTSPPQGPARSLTGPCAGPAGDLPSIRVKWGLGYPLTTILRTKEVSSCREPACFQRSPIIGFPLIEPVD